MKFKKGLLVILLIICLFAMASVSANDVNDVTLVSEDTSAMELSADNEMAADNLQSGGENQLTAPDEQQGSENNESLTASAKTFTDLNEAINGNLDSDIYLTGNYTYNPENDGAFVHGVTIDRSVTIWGNGITIDGSGLARIFNVSTDDEVVFHDITFVNGNASGNGYHDGWGGAIHTTRANKTAAINCKFTNNCAYNNGGAMAYGQAINCTFANNYVINYNGGATDSVFATNCTFINNYAPRSGAMRSGFARNCIFIINHADDEGNHTGGTECYNCIELDSAVLNVSDFVFPHNTGEKLSFNLTNGSQIIEGASILISLSQNGHVVKEYRFLTGQDWLVDLRPGEYNATFSIMLGGYSIINPHVSSKTINMNIWSDGTTFCDLDDAINGNQDAVINLDKDYAFNSTFDSVFKNGIVINRQVTINGNGHTIDAKGQARIFDVKGSWVTINNVTFANGRSDYGGAIDWSGSFGSISDSCFISNNASGSGGAVYWTGSNGVISDSYFISNNASGSGGAVYWKSFNGDVSGCSFISNNANQAGGAVYASGESDCISGCSFISNNVNQAGGAVYWDDDYGGISGCSFISNNANQAGGAILWHSQIGNVSNSYFINNSAIDGGAVYASNSVNLYYCWFGGNATNYKNHLPIKGQVTCNYILFLNATANPNNVTAFNTSEIVFKLYLYNKGISDYDNTLLPPVNLTIISTNGHVDSPIANLGDSISYTAAGVGNGSVTAKFATAEFTIELNIIMANPNLSAEDQVITYGENATIALNYAPNATGKVNITFTGKKGNFTYLNLDLNETFVFSNDFPADNYNVTVTYSGDENYLNATANATLTVNKANSTLTVPAVTFDYGDSGTSNVSYTYATGIVAVVNDSHAIVEVNGTLITVSNLTAGNYILTVTAIGDENHTNVTKTANITVNKVDSSLNVDNVVLDYGGTTNVTALTDGAVGIVALIDGNEVGVVGFTIPIAGLDAGNHTLTVSTIGDANHNSVTKTANITVNKVDSSLSIDNVVLDYGVTVNVPVTADGAVGIVALIDGNEVGVVGFTIPISGLNVGNHTLTVSTIADANHNSVAKTVNITVYKVDSTLTLKNMVFDYNSTGSTKISYVGAVGVNASVIGHPEAVVNVKNNLITVSGLDLGTYTLTVTTIADANHYSVTKNATITVNKINTQISAKAVTTTYKTNKNLVIALKDRNGRALSGLKVTVNLNGAKTYTTDKNGQIKINVANLVPKTYTAKITFAGNDLCKAASANVKVTVKKAKTKIIAKKKTFKNVKKYKLTLKSGKKPTKKVKVTVKIGKKTYKAKTNSKGKATFKVKSTKKGKVAIKYKATFKSDKEPIKKVKVTVKIGKKTYKAKTNSNGKATFKIKLAKGKYKAVIKFKGNKYYTKATKKVKIKIK